MKSAQLPISILDPTPAQTTFTNVKTALSKRNYKDTVSLASIAVVDIQRLQLMTILDHRAYALGMQGSFDAAVKDAEEMIVYGPEMAAGYLRLGYILDLQGKQSRAAKVYQEALEKVSKEDSAYAQLLTGKKVAMEKAERRVDFLATLPLELGDDIIMQMPDKTMAICLDVSTTWRKRVSGCHLAWVNVSNDDDTAHAIIARALPYIAEHIKDLVITTTDPSVWLRYLYYMERGHFRTIEALEVTNAATKLINTNMIMALTSALWQMRNTLTRLEFCFHSYLIPITLTDVLFYCTHLESLVFNAWDSLELILGDLELLGGPHKRLVDLEMTISLTTSAAVEPLLKRLPKLRRLSLNESMPDVLDVVYRTCPNLEIFGYNPSFGIPDLDDLEGDSNGPGLRAIYTANGGYGTPTAKFLPFLRRDMKTLQTVYANLSLTEDQVKNDEPYEDPYPAYRDLNFERLTSLTFWPDKFGIIQTLILRAVSSCTTLNHIAAVATPNVPALVDTLITLPPLEEMELSHITADDGGPSLVRLFQLYASLSESKQKFRTFWFRYCNSITDDVLDAIAGIKSLKEVTLTGLVKVSARGLKSFLKRLSKIGVTEVKLVQMAVVDNSVIELLGDMEGLETVILESLSEITDEGIKGMVDGAKGLRSLTLDKCKTISKDTVSYVQRRVGHVEIIEQ